MFINLIKKLNLKFNPPKVGQVYYGDVLQFIVGKPVEYVLHRLLDKNGNRVAEIVPSPDCYRITIESDSMSEYYRCSSEVFCFTPETFVWMPRSQSRRIRKDLFKKMIIEGSLKKGK